VLGIVQTGFTGIKIGDLSDLTKEKKLMKGTTEENLNNFGNTASKLAQNPLGIIALFIVLVYAFASLVVGFGRNLAENHTTVLVWFMVLFPALVLGVFAWLVSQHHTKLYAPKDYQKEENFIAALGFDVENLKSVPPQDDLDTSTKLSRVENIQLATSNLSEIQVLEEKVNKHDSEIILDRVEEREKIYRDSRLMVLVHALTPSNKPGFKYDISIYAKRHGDEDISDVAKAEFFFGKSWGHKIFTGTREGGIIGVSTSAYGTFLCTCLITFTDGQQASIYRYVDFEMGEVVQKLIGNTAAQ
jgi:hypothetical protein